MSKQWLSPAKLNLFLHITCQRADGYHFLQTAFQFLDYSDELSFELRSDGIINLVNSIEGVPDKDNLIVRAANILQQHPNCDASISGANINLIKKLPTLKETKWFYVILDEAQAIKNPNTKQSKTIKKLTSFNRIILTGTPIENRLSNLWSLLDFTNPGLLGSSKEFSTYTRSLDSHPNKYGKLKSVIQPYLLRRLKTDKNIISDLNN